MTEYVFFVEGLGREIAQRGETERAARNAIWNALTDEEKNRVVIFDCVEQREQLRGPMQELRRFEEEQNFKQAMGPPPAMTLQEAFETLDNLKVGDFSVHEEIDNFDGRRHCFVVYFAALLESPRAHFYGSTLKDTMDQALAAYKLRCQKQEVAV